MPERRYCLDCGYVGHMNIHGRCGTCNSEAVVLAESIYQFTADFNRSVDECYKIFALPAESGGR